MEEKDFQDIETHYEIQFVLTNSLGVFEGMRFILSKTEFENLANLSKNFFSGGGFELYCDDGFMVFPPEIVQKSILRIKKRMLEDEEVIEYISNNFDEE